MGRSIDRSLVRKPAVAGSFYPSDPLELSKMIAGMLSKVTKEGYGDRIVSIVVPHAGYIYSGQVAAYVYKELEGLEYDTVFVLSPSHSAYFRGATVYNGGAYQTPLGEVSVDVESAEELASLSKVVEISEEGHASGHGRGEHALEVQLPFLQIVLGGFRFVPIVMGEQDLTTSEALGKGIAVVVAKKRALIVASSDLSHFHPAEAAERLDQTVVDDFNRFDHRALAGDLARGRAEACGGGPIVAAMTASKELGATLCQTVKYAHSGHVSGDYSSVVGYMAGLICK
jgi:AmmeMemoRadiSam system protein B